MSEFVRILGAVAQLLGSLPRIEKKLDAIISNQEKRIMPGLADVKTALAAEHADLVTITGLVTQLLAAVASGSLSSTDAQALLDSINGDDATVKTSIAAIQAALPTPPVTGQP